jgi:alkylation response protein AidB-like acyl-CoA dehydrogenase
MNFNLSEEQTLIRDSIERFVADNYEFDKRNATVASEHGYSTDNWTQFAELGWLSIPFAEEHGGFNGGPVDTMVIMNEFGKGLVAEPYLPTVILFGGLLQAGANDALKEELIPQIIGGELQGAFAYLERQSRYALSDVATRATKEGSDWIINGEKTVVLNGGAAQKMIVAARASGEQSDESGITLFLVDASATGVERTTYRMTDGQEAANISFTDVTAEAVIGNAGEGFPLMQSVINDAIIAVAANALGAMESLNAQTLEYCKTREQFGVAIGTFQALQHRMVDMFASYESQKSLLYRAVCAVDAQSEDAQRSLLALKVMTGRAGRHIGGEAIQLHGGMGMTDELPVGFFVKRLMLLNTLFGDADHHQQRFAQLVNDDKPIEASGRSEAA